MSSIMGSADSLSKSAGGLAAGLQERNRYWILFLLSRIAEVDGKMRATGALEQTRETAAVASGSLATPPGAEVRAVVTAAGGSSWTYPAARDGGNNAAVEAE